ncbi:hypothetical protein [Hydrotalea sp.]|uniref:hypothetical protein n=1 Tax=Hydrotalea sp. TaxID=2881279 RepID=UPI00258DDA15|nr:hypothetical protein [Hydrotalea sp.]
MSPFSMNLTINDNKNIQTLQSEFNAMFPFLRLMLTKAQTEGATSRNISVKQPFDEHTTLLAYKIAPDAAPITIYPEMTVSELEHQFVQQYGLEPIILRKSGKVWIETSITDDWTLEEQNTQGELITRQMNERNKPS